MPFPAAGPRSDLFCKVVDNYGDIGVCWRLARQLASEHGIAVRLWVDRVEVLAKLCPSIDPALPVQSCDGVEVRRWDADFPDVVPADLVIEAFACHLPERFVAAMAARRAPPVWINLDYLSAEDWVAGCHTLPSPHPRLPLVKYFFFPGFDAATGGLLRERDLARDRQAFLASSQAQGEFWRRVGLPPPPADALVVSLFAYAGAPLADLLAAWEQARAPVCCLLPASATRSEIEALLGQPLRSGDCARRGALELRVLPFVAQPDYDRLLWSCDLNFVRGEDSFVRAQWAAKPLVWNIYPQDEGAHLVKLEAFLARYCSGLDSRSEAAARVLRALFLAWNDAKGAQPIDAGMWSRFIDVLPEIRAHASNWENILSKQEDLCRNLVRFYRSKL